MRGCAATCLSRSGCLGLLLVGVGLLASGYGLGAWALLLAVLVLAVARRITTRGAS